MDRSEELVRPGLRDHRAKLGDPIGGGPLREAEIARPDRRVAPVEPGLAAQPRNRVGGVAHLVDERLEDSAPAERAAAALQQHPETALGKDTSLEESEK